VSGYLTVAIGGRELAAPLDQVREVVRAVGIEALPGSRAPITGLVQLRGEPLPVVDLRTAPYPGGTGDLVVLVGRVDAGESGALALAVDRVIAVVTAAEYELSDAAVPPGLPAYVTALLRPAGSTGEPRTVFEVDLWALAGLVA